MAAAGSGTDAAIAPGNVANGKIVYVKYCGKCHTLEAAGARGTLGNNLDHVDVTFSCTVSAIENGVGGIQAEYVLRNVSFQQVYDVAAYVAEGLEQEDRQRRPAPRSASVLARRIG